MIRVGHLRPNYAERRLIIRKVSGVDYVEVADSARRGAYLVSRMNAMVGREIVSPITLDNIFYSNRIRGLSLLHLVNAVSFGPTPWVSTFETIVPRFAGNLVHSWPDPDFRVVASNLLNRAAVRAMSHSRCLGLISLSSCARAIEQDFLANFGRHGDGIDRKLVVLHPPQPLNVTKVRSAASRSSAMPLRLTFVGASFARKGGRELLEALRHLRTACGLSNFHLTVVSAMNVDPYATGETARDLEEARRMMAADSTWITWHPELRNDEVIDLMRDTDVGLLPTHADTYGYTALEFQSCGVPVVSTDVRALPEINSESCGWLIRVTKNRFGEALYQTAAERSARATEIGQGLIAILGTILRYPQSIEPKGVAALERIRARHDPGAYGERLRAIYEDGISGSTVTRGRLQATTRRRSS